jgi:nucleotide exchange factor SIL1
LDVNTGVKEARLNIPIEGEEAGTLEGIPVEQAMVVVESDEIISSETSSPQPEEEAIQKALRDHHNKQPPPYEAAGKIQPPPPTGEDIGKFEKAKLTLAMEGRVFDSALDDLKELSHDLYYGLEIAKDGPVLEKLVCLILGSGTEKFHAKDNKRDQKAAAILASAVQNNPTALKEVAAMSRMVFSPTCGTELPAPKNNNFVRILRNRLGREKDPATLKSKVAAISGLLKDETIRSSFLESDGMELLLAIWLKKGGQWDTTRAKVADAVMDNFLDEDLGAVLGVWPKEAVEESAVCEEKGKMLTDGCWEHHIGSFLKTSPTSSWAEDLLKSLQRERKKLKVEVKHQEL